MTITLERLTERTIAVVRTIVGSIGIIYAGGILTIGTPDAPVTEVHIGDGVTPVAVDVFGGTVAAAEFIGDLDGNAATATLALLASEASALETARTLWGQSFDGTANVDGTLTIAAGATQALSLTSTNAVQATVRYDATARLDISVSSIGIVTLTPVGAVEANRRIITGYPFWIDVGALDNAVLVTSTGSFQFQLRYDATAGNNIGISVGSTGNSTIGPSGANDKNLTLRYRVSIADESGSASISDAVALYLPAGTTTLAPVRIPNGAAPAAPGEGDLWHDGTTLRLRVGAVSQYASWAEQAAIAAPSGGTVIDSEGRTAIDLIRAALIATNITA